MLYGIDIDELIPKYERSQNFNLVDVGAFFLVGPLRAGTHQELQFCKLVRRVTGRKRDHQQTRLNLESK